MDAKARAEGPKLKRTLNDDVPNNWACGDVDSGSARERMGNVLSVGHCTEGSGTFRLEDSWRWDSRAGMKMNWNPRLCGTSKIENLNKLPYSNPLAAT
jgi:hypothetical protein